MTQDKRVILLVEDNPDDELLALRAIARNQIENPVMVVRSGAEAIHYLFGLREYAARDRAELPQLILLDLSLPQGDGVELLRQIRSDERTHPIPVVILTNSDHERDRQTCYRFFANNYVRKPANFDDFLDVMRQVKHYWLNVDQAPLIRGNYAQFMLESEREAQGRTSVSKI